MNGNAEQLTIKEHLAALEEAWNSGPIKRFYRQMERRWPALHTALKAYAEIEAASVETDDCEITFLDRLHIVDELWEDADVSPEDEKQFVQAFIEHWRYIRDLMPFEVQPSRCPCCELRRPHSLLAAER